MFICEICLFFDFVHTEFDWQIYFTLEMLEYSIFHSFHCNSLKLYSCSCPYFIWLQFCWKYVRIKRTAQCKFIQSIGLRLSFWFVNTIGCVVCVRQYLFTISKKHTARVYLHINWLRRRRAEGSVRSSVFYLDFVGHH